MRRTISVIAMATATVCGSTISVSAHNVECDQRLRAAPVETVAVPTGWDWDRLEWNALGIWAGSLGDADEDSFEYANLFAQCSDDATATMARQREVRDAVGDVETITVVPIGDETNAYREGGLSYIVWRKGDVMASMVLSEGADYGAIEEFASAVNELLP